MSKRALITGITGQDGSYLAELLLEKGYEVHGVVRRSSSFNRARIEHIYKDAQTSTGLFLHYGDLTDPCNLVRLMSEIKPQEIYNLGSQSHVKISFETASYTAQVVALGTLYLLEAIRAMNFDWKIKFYQASSSEMFGKVVETPQKETTPFYPRSPYAIAKVYAYWTTRHYREAYDMFACNGILFNHESPRRGENFVTRKITKGIADILTGKQHKLYLGNLNAERDWGYALDFVEAMWLILQQEEPDDFVIATKEMHSVREFVEEAFGVAGIDIGWYGKGLNEKGFDKKTCKVCVVIDPRYFRLTEADTLLGDFSKAKKVLGWSPRVTFKKLVEIMVKADLKEAGYELKK